MKSTPINKNGSRFPGGRLRFGVLLVPLLLGLQQTHAQSVTHTVSFAGSAVSLSPVTAPDGLTYARVSCGDLIYSEKNPGHPQLPVQYVNLIVPKNKNYSSVSVSPGSAQKISLSNPVWPVQQPVPGNETPAPAYAGPDPLVYSSGNPYPGPLVEYVSEGYYDGDKHIITLAVHPVQYVPSAASLNFYSSVTFTVAENTGVPVTMTAIAHAPAANQAVLDKALAGLVANPEDIATFTTTGNDGPVTQPLGTALPFYEYVVITSAELKPAFEELVGWKRRKGLNAGIIDINDILTDLNYASGDLVSNINDPAGKLHQYLADAYQQGTRYVVLGGDLTIIPLRYAAGGTNSWTYAGQNAHIPCDLYYSDMNGNWNVDNDEYYGEDGQDQIDYNPELYVGRVLARTREQAINHIHKIIRYERNPGRGDNDYVAQAFLDQADEPQAGNEAGMAVASMPFYTPANTTIMEEIPGWNEPNTAYPTGVDVINMIKQNKGFVAVFAHGGPWGIAVSQSAGGACPRSFITAYDAITSSCNGTATGNGLDNLDDYNHVLHPYQDYGHVAYTVSCETIPYDNEIGNPSPYQHFGNTYTNESKAGAAAYIGNTRVGWVYSSTQVLIQLGQQLTLGNTNLGIAQGLSKIAPNFTFCRKVSTLIGCPETDMWTAKPSLFTNASVSGTGTVTVNTGDGQPAKICVISALDDGATYQQVQTGSSATFTGVPAPYAVCITRHNYIPYLWPASTTVQGATFTGTAYVGGDQVNDNSGTGPAVPTVVQSGANVYFHAESDIQINQEFTVEAGAAFEAK